MHNDNDSYFEIDLEMESINNRTNLDKEFYRVFPEYQERSDFNFETTNRITPSLVLNNYGSIGNININSTDMPVKAETTCVYDLDKLDRIENSNKCQDQMKELLELQCKMKGLVNKTRRDLIVYLEETMKEIEKYIETRKKSVLITLKQLDTELSNKVYTEYELEEIARRLNQVSLQTLNIVNDFRNIK
jgi:hypothetical protein